MNAATLVLAFSVLLLPVHIQAATSVSGGELEDMRVLLSQFREYYSTRGKEGPDLHDLETEVPEESSSEHGDAYQVPVTGTDEMICNEHKQNNSECVGAQGITLSLTGEEKLALQDPKGPLSPELQLYLLAKARDQCETKAAVAENDPCYCYNIPQKIYNQAKKILFWKVDCGNLLNKREIFSQRVEIETWANKFGLSNDVTFEAHNKGEGAVRFKRQYPTPGAVNYQIDGKWSDPRCKPVESHTCKCVPNKGWVLGRPDVEDAAWNAFVEGGCNRMAVGDNHVSAIWVTRHDVYMSALDELVMSDRAQREFVWFPWTNGAMKRQPASERAKEAKQWFRADCNKDLDEPIAKPYAEASPGNGCE